MNYIKYTCLVIISLFIFSGCSIEKTNDDSKEQIVKDDEVINNIKNNIISLETLDKTFEIYRKGNGKKDDYTNNEKLTSGLNSRFANGGLNKPTAEQLINKKLDNIDGTISVSEAKEYVSKTFGEISIEYKTLDGCPSYIYSEDEKLFYVKYGCSNKKVNDVISFIDIITKKDNEYYADVYVGVIDNETKKVYGNIEKTKYILEIKNDDFFVIDEKNKEQFDRYKYTFTKDSNGNYVFTSIEKNK